MSAFHTECEQFMEFYRSLCRFCSKSMWRKNDKGVVCFWATNFCTQQKLLNKNSAKKNSTLTLIEFVNSERRKWKWICQKWTFRHLEDQSPYQRLAPRRSDSFKTKWGQQGRRRFTRIAQNYLMGAKITLKKYYICSAPVWPSDSFKTKRGQQGGRLGLWAHQVVDKEGLLFLILDFVTIVSFWCFCHKACKKSNRCFRYRFF